MKVKELIEKLKEYPENLPVFVKCGNIGLFTNFIDVETGIFTPHNNEDEIFEVSECYDSSPNGISIT